MLLLMMPPMAGVRHAAIVYCAITARYVTYAALLPPVYATPPLLLPRIPSLLR